MRITLDNVKGKILKTAKTVIREDIEVVPKLEDVEINANGLRKVSEGYSGIGEVLVNVQSGGSGSWAGVFDDDKVYYVGDIVYYDGGIYERTKYSQMIQLPTNAEYWSLLAEVVSGSKAIHTNGPHDVTQYKTIHVAVPDENNWEGDYEDGIAYKYGALVVYNVGVYLALKDTDGTQNPTNEEYWEKLTPIWNDTSDATATEDDVVYGQTFYAGGEKKAGAMKMVDSSTFSSLMLENRGEGLLDINYYANENSYIPNTKDLTRPGTIGTIVEPKFKAENIAEGVTLFGISGKHGSTPIFDGTINIESSLTTISGCYIIDADKAYRALSALPASKTYTVDFSAGSFINGDQEKKGFISMTFNVDGDKSIIYGRSDGSITAFSSTEHMTGGNGFAPYYNAYEEGYGAMVNFYEGTVCRRDFKELFLSIADVNDLAPEEPAEDELAGTWFVNDQVSSLPIASNMFVSGIRGTANYYDTVRNQLVPFEINSCMLYKSGDIRFLNAENPAFNGSVYAPYVGAVYKNTWYQVYVNSGQHAQAITDLISAGVSDENINAVRTVVITSSLSDVTNGSTLLTWLKDNATKQ